MKAVFFALLLAATSVFAQPAKSVFLDEFTWTELRDQVAAGKTTIIVPIGGTEQSGPHMALGKHNVRAKVLSGKIASELGNALVAPVVAYVPEGAIAPPSQHMRFPGTVTVPDDAFERTLESAARGFNLHGFKDVVFLGDHGGYQKNVVAVANRLNREWAKTATRAHAIREYYDAADTAYAAALKGRGISAEAIGTHAGLADTSLTLAIDPSLVRSDRLPDAPSARYGVNGDPRKASAELGRIGVDLIVASTVAAIRKATRR